MNYGNMRGRLVLLLACVLLCASLAPAQTTQEVLGFEPMLERLEQMIQAGDRSQLAPLLESAFPVERADQFASDIFQDDVLRAVVRERDRNPIEGEPAGSAYRLVVELFTETAGHARILTTLVDFRRPEGGDAESWRIADIQGLTSIAGLYRLRINPLIQFAATNLTIAAEDLLLSLESGSVFVVESEQGITGLVLFGRGTMRFTPAPETERGQLRIFSGAETLTAPFDTAFVRVNPSDYRRLVSPASLAPTTPDPGELRRAQEVLATEGPKTFSLDLSELSSEVWYLLPPSGDFLAEIRTRRHGALTYARSAVQSEDVSLFQREQRRTIALYPSAERVTARGRFFNEDDQRDYDVLDYNIEATVSPEREALEGSALLRVRVLADRLTSLMFRLADSLTVSAAASIEQGRLLPLRVRDQNTVIVNLPMPLTRGDEFTILIEYSGQISPLGTDSENVDVSGQNQDEPGSIALERNFLLSNRSYWYPQNPITDFATATLRLVVPAGFGIVASGEPSTDVTLRDLLTLPQGRLFVFRAADPLRYFALAVSRFVRVAAKSIVTTSGDEVRIAIDANPRQQGPGRALMSRVEDIVQFYAETLGDAPYSSATVALVEHEFPGGHSPGYFALLNTPLQNAQRTSWRNDPAAFSGFPDFFIAHELAHQWWGQAVGWRNYHDQWISEGFAQYFAALYAQHARGNNTFVGMLRQFRRWAVAESDEGPVSLGYRLGHLKGDARIFRALVYNKGAAALHMLRRLLGDEAFFSGLRRFYAEQKFQKAGTDDFRRAMEAASGRSLERFFEQWIHGTNVPRVRYATTIADGAVTARFEQVGDLVFDIPVTVTIVYSDGRTQEAMVPVTERIVTQRIATTGDVRQVHVNRDYAAVAEFTDDR